LIPLQRLSAYVAWGEGNSYAGPGNIWFARG
jgi:hypothetical protein